MSSVEFKNMLVEKYPTVDIDKCLSIIEKNLNEIQPCGEGNTVPKWLTTDLNKHIIIKVLSEYNS
jgi:hypothetical protein